MVYFWKQLRLGSLLSLFFMALVSCSGSSGEDTSRALASPKATIDQSLKEISPLNAENYVVSGKCDSSLQTKVVVTLGRPNVQVNLDCQADGTFTGEVDIRSIVSNPATITVTQSNPSDSQASGYSATSDFVNHMVPLALEQMISLEPSNVASYRVLGNCESAFGDVRIKIDDQSLNLNFSKSTVCSSSNSDLNTFRADLNIARSLAGPIIIQLAQGSQGLDLRTASLNYTLIASASPLLSINQALLAPLSLSNASAYVITGSCDPSLDVSGRATIGTPDVSKVWDCGDQKTFSVSLDASGITSYPNATITVTYGDDTKDTTVTNNIPQLEVDTPITTSNQGDYLVSGKCNSNISGQVMVTIEETNVSAFSDCDGNNNTFSTSFNATDVVNNPVSMTVTHGSQEQTIQVSIERIVRFQSIDTGEFHTCALTINGSVKCWGKGVLGNGSEDYTPTPVPVDVHTSFANQDPLSNIAAISVGGNHTCALTTSDSVKCWGYGSYGGLGNGISHSTTPMDVLLP